MSKALNEDIFFNEPEQVQEPTLPVTDADLMILMEKFSGFEIPTKVFSQALAIAAYDRASAFRYADNYVNVLKNKTKRKHWLLLHSSSDLNLGTTDVDFGN